MAGSRIDKLYESFKNGLIKEFESNDFYNYFINALSGSANNIMAYEKLINRNIDLQWVETIEKTIIPLDNIIRNPGRFIKNEEEIVPIELVKHITPESIRHLAQHTNMISSVNGDEVLPNRLLNVTKEESFDTYENRFIFTLLMQVEYFLDKRMRVLMEGSKTADEFAYSISGETAAGHDNIKYSLSMEMNTPHVDVTEQDILLNADVSQMTNLQRVERIRKIFYGFRSSQFVKSMEGCSLVRPPLTYTNMMKKNPDYIQAVALWEFLNTYSKTGYDVELVERQLEPDEDFLNELYSVLVMQYIVLKKHTNRTQDLADYQERRRVLTPHMIKKKIDDIAEVYDVSIEEVRKVFLEQVEQESKRQKLKLTKMRDVIARAMKAQRNEYKKKNTV